MIINPRLKHCYSVEFLDHEKILVVSEKESSILISEIHRMVLAEIMENSLSSIQLASRLSETVPDLQVYFTINDLEQRGYITEAFPEEDPETAAYWEGRNMDIHTLRNGLQEKSVTVKALGTLSSESFEAILQSQGVKISATGDVTVVITDDYAAEELDSINRDALARTQPWMLMKPSGITLWLGPLFIPGKTACWECLKQRLIINRPMDTFYRSQKKSAQRLQVPQSHFPLSSQIAYNHAALEIIKWLYDESNEALAGNIITIDTQTLDHRAHSLIKRPQCKVCGDVDYKRVAVPIVLEGENAPCKSVSGGYREITPEETIHRYRKHVSPITGVVQALHPYYSIKGAPIYNYSSGHNMALQSKTLYWMNEHVRSASGGKGKTWGQAKAGALCEAVERYSLMYHGDEPVILASMEEIGNDAIHPNLCMNFSQNQYKNRDETNRACSKFYAIVPVPFEPTLQMDWSPVWSLTEKKCKYLPSCFCYAQYPAMDESRLFSYPDSNGCAAGNSVTEAILQGFLEIVERDSVAIWWYNKLRVPAVDLLSFNDPYYKQLMDYYRTLKRNLYVLDITSDLGIPAFAAVSYRTDDDVHQNILFGFGAHVDAGLAVERALIELNQLLAVGNVSEEHRVKGNFRTRDKAFVDWLHNATVENQPYILPSDHAGVKTAAQYPQLCEENIFSSVMFCIDRAQKKGLETLVLDLTRPDVGLSVVRVFVPGMRHFWKRTAPGRLYDVPVNTGLLEQPLHEQELNTIALFI